MNYNSGSIFDIYPSHFFGILVLRCDLQNGSRKLRDHLMSKNVNGK